MIFMDRAELQLKIYIFWKMSSEKTNNKYWSGKIYKIINNTTSQFYIGSTTKKIEHRFQEHISCSKNEEKYSAKIYKHMRETDIDDWSVSLIQIFPCETKDELREREQYYIALLKPELNEFKAYCPEETQSEYNAVYRKDNRAKIAETNKNYRDKNKERLAKYCAIYNEKNKARIAETKRIYYVKNKERIAAKQAEKIECEICGFSLLKRHFKKHCETKRHASFFGKSLAKNQTFK